MKFLVEGDSKDSNRKGKRKKRIVKMRKYRACMVIIF